MTTTAARAEAAYTIDEAAALKRVSPGFIRKAIRSTGEPDPRTGQRVVPLRAKKVGKGYRIPASALEEWFDGLDDA